ncbi:MAG: SusD/RagB family nutrient-binding outer membrane lipoprotein [Pseudopedobacter saltans]|uniref:SusD/RagB family nutrient-binding outer membrane lipoprotein n=1 Tax=Pseudopedobacter saltans TaxID=151895 RepID=A0A2W5FFS7_9SPHI|nr:MAG: SusD/RagB family nutrient-binding outer membrane lipoprotein [Pseudopedobacter saltans]
MKNYNKYFARFKQVLLFASFGIGLFGCTKKFEEYNSDPRALTNEQSLVALPSAFPSIQQAIYSNYQVAQNLSADGYAGYFMSPTPFKSAYNLNYFLVDAWNSSGFNDQYTKVFASINAMAKLDVQTTHPDWWAIALILKVEAMHRVTDKYGPIAYSEAGTAITNIAYDSQQEVYTQFFAELDTAIANLHKFISANPTSTPLKGNDAIYDGDYTKWLKFANSLRLRLAMHLVNIDKGTAQAEGEKALADAGGLLTTAADNAAITQAGGRENDFYQEGHDWGDLRISAAITSYMNGYKDPRLSIYFTPAVDVALGGLYTGIRIGSNLPSKDDYEGYCNLNYSTFFAYTSPQLIMTASEIWFLKAAASLRGWANAGDLATNYTTGIQTSMNQWGVSSANALTFINDATSKPANYVDPKNAANNINALSSITIKWDATSSKEVMLERIITQKWLAMFPEGQEAWTTYRRTGYPRLFPVVNNTSNGTISTALQIRRINYPSNEYSSNKDAVTAAVTLLGGPDTGGTPLWWDTNKGQATPVNF